MTDWVEIVAGEKLQRYQRAATVLRTLGWLSICWAALVSIWIWMGAKAGSNLWLWSTVVLFAIGVVFLMIAGRLQSQSAKVVEVPESPKNSGMRAA